MNNTNTLIKPEDETVVKTSSVHFSFREDEEFENKMNKYFDMADKCDEHSSA